MVAAPTSGSETLRAPDKEWHQTTGDKIEVFYLPSYSPEMNPDELLIVDLKKGITAAAPALYKIALTITAVDTLHSIQEQPQRVEIHFKHKDA